MSGVSQPLFEFLFFFVTIDTLRYVDVGMIGIGLGIRQKLDTHCPGVSGQRAEWNNGYILTTRSTQSWTRLLIRARRYDVSVVFTFTLWCSSGFTSYPTVFIYGNGNPKCFIPGFSGSTHEKDHLLSIISGFLVWTIISLCTKLHARKKKEPVPR